MKIQILYNLPVKRIPDLFALSCIKLYFTLNNFIRSYINFYGTLRISYSITIV